MNVTVTWYDESGILVLKQVLKDINQTLAEPWLLLDEVLARYSMPNEPDWYYKYHLVVEVEQTSRLYTPYLVQNRQHIQEFRARALDYANGEP